MTAPVISASLERHADVEEAVVVLRSQGILITRIASRLNVKPEDVQRILGKDQGGRAITGERMVVIADLTMDESCRPRVELPEVTIAEYADVFHAGGDFDPIVVYNTGELLVDGWIRVAAACTAERSEILADVREGDRRAAVLYAVGSNAHHGLRRTNPDKRCCVGLLLDDPEWSGRSNRWVADQAGVSLDLVNRVRRQLNESFSSVPDDEPRIGRDGKKRKPRKYVRSSWRKRSSPDSGNEELRQRNVKVGGNLSPTSKPDDDTPPPDVAAEIAVELDATDVPDDWSLAEAMGDARRTIGTLCESWPHSFRRVLADLVSVNK